jgi:hypothetical protein
MGSDLARNGYDIAVMRYLVSSENGGLFIDAKIKIAVIVDPFRCVHDAFVYDIVTEALKERPAFCVLFHFRRKYDHHVAVMALAYLFVYLIRPGDVDDDVAKSLSIFRCVGEQPYLDPMENAHVCS